MRVLAIPLAAAEVLQNRRIAQQDEPGHRLQLVFTSPDGPQTRFPAHCC